MSVGIPLLSTVNLYTISCRIIKDKTKIDMKWLTLERIKQNSRIDGNEEDAILTAYGNAAENGILRLMNRTWEDVCENLSQEDIDGALTIAGLELVEHLYTHRGPDDNVQVYQIPYGIDFWVKPYMRLASKDNEQNNTQEYGCKNL